MKRHRFADSGGLSAETSAKSGRYLNDGDAEKMDDRDIDNSEPNHEDGDADSSYEYEETFDNRRYHDGDDRKILSFGHPASVAQTWAVTGAIKRYYAVAAREEGGAACALLVGGLASSVAEDYGNGAGAAYLRGASTCPEVMTRLFRHSRRYLTSAVTVTGVRIEGAERALAFVGSTVTPASDVALNREKKTWKIASLLGSPLP